MNTNFENCASGGLGVRRWSLSDIDAILRLEMVCHSHPWSQRNFEDAFEAGYIGLVLEHEAQPQTQQTDKAMLGYCIAMPVLEELHLLNLSVAPDKRRAGCAALLWHHLECEALRAGQSSIWLEVRQSNLAAQALYSKMGASQVGMRKNYYAKSRTEREDALLMRKNVKQI